MTGLGADLELATPDQAAQAARTMNRWLLDALDHVASVGIAQPGAQEVATTTDLLAQAGAALFRIAPITGGAFFLLDPEVADFPLAWCQPAARQDEFRAEVEAQIRDGVFAWALQNNHPVVVPAATHPGGAMLHALATRNGPLGLFLGTLAERAPFIPDGCQKLISIVMTSCATNLRSEGLRAELKGINRGLEASIEQRTTELRQARDTAFRAAQVKSEFLANMSHEIRTPMNAVLGTVAMLLDSNLAGDQRGLAETIASSGRDLLTIINDILDFSKLEAGKLRVESIPFDPKETVTSVTSLLAAKAEAKGIKLRTGFGEGIAPQVLGDPGRLRQVLTNLIDNAIKFTEQGFVMVHVTREPGPPDVQPITFTIKDSGIGIAREKVASIFEKFTQADASTTRKYGGTGLGLTICRQLTELMGGSIVATSEPGAGSTFTVRIPFRTAEPVATPETPRPAGPTRLHGRILLAEDYPANQRIARWMLERLGCDVTIAADGREALARLAAEPFDLVLMDCQMPEMDGYDATRAIRSSGAAYGTIPIVAMTAAALSTDRDRCFAVGMNDYISKPVQPEDLAGVLARWLPAAPTA